MNTTDSMKEEIRLNRRLARARDKKKFDRSKSKDSIKFPYHPSH